MTTDKQPNKLLPNWGYIPAGQDVAIKRLVRAIIIQATRDAQLENPVGVEARYWLLSEECFMYCEFSGLNFEAVKDWVRKGCPAQ